MKKLERIVDMKLTKKKSAPFRVLENNMTRAFELERKINMSKFSALSKYQARRQFVVILVSFMESYLRDITRLAIEKSAIPINKMFELDRTRKLRYTLEEVKKIREDDINLSDLVIHEINFQKYEDIMMIASLLGFEEHFESVTSRKKGW